MRAMKTMVAAAGFLLMLSQSVSAQNIIPSYPVVLQGSDVVQLKGKLKGPDNGTRDYVVHVKKGETLSVALEADKASSTYFNVLRPDGDEALFVGEMQEENKWQQQIEAEGEYVIRIYINRAVARRGESSRYTLSISAY